MRQKTQPCISVRVRPDNYGSVSSVACRMKITLNHDGRLRRRVERLDRQLGKA